MADSVSDCGPSLISGDPEPSRLLIVGLGNPMMADDGIGHEVVRRLDQCNLPNSVRILTIDEDVLALTQLWKGEHAVWLVDAVSGDLPAGTLRVYDHQDLLHLPAEGFSTHHTNMSENLRWMLHGQPEMAAIEFRLYGIEAGVIRPERGLSRAVEGGVNRLVDGLRRAARDLISTSSDSLARRKEPPPPLGETTSQS